MNHHVARLLAAQRIADLKRARPRAALSQHDSMSAGFCAGDLPRPRATKDGTPSADARRTPRGETRCDERPPLPNGFPRPVAFLNERCVVMLLRVLARRTLLPVTATAVLFSGGAVAQAASSVSLCVPSTPNTAVTSASSTGTCASGATAVALPASSSAQQTLISILPYIFYEDKYHGIGGKPTIVFSGANVQIDNGMGTESATALNGAGNLVIGDPAPSGVSKQSGSDNLVLAASNQSYTSYGGIVVGDDNSINAPDASVLGGFNNTVAKTGQYATISGGNGNGASGEYSSVTGGQGNLAADSFASITGGCDNLAGSGSTPTGSCNPNGLEAILGGYQNRASGPESSISGGIFNVSSGSHTSVSGGGNNTATDGPGGGNAWVGGGAGNTASNVDAAILGGVSNTVSSNCGTFPNTGQSC